MQKQLIAEEKRRQEELLRRKKQMMLEKFEKLAQKGRYNKDEFYREVFTPNSLALLSKLIYKSFFFQTTKYLFIMIITPNKSRPFFKSRTVPF